MEKISFMSRLKIMNHFSQYLQRVTNSKCAINHDHRYVLSSTLSRCFISSHLRSILLCLEAIISFQAWRYSTRRRCTCRCRSWLHVGLMSVNTHLLPQYVPFADSISRHCSPLSVAATFAGELIYFCYLLHLSDLSVTNVYPLPTDCEIGNHFLRLVLRVGHEKINNLSTRLLTVDYMQMCYQKKFVCYS